MIAFVLGGANTLKKDLHRAYTMLGGEPDHIITTNHAGRDFEPNRPYHWCTLHTELMGGWIAERRAMGLPELAKFWTSNAKTIPTEHEDMYSHVTSWDGSSGLLAVTVALELGCDKIVLCGVPLDKKAEHYDYGGLWMDAPRYRGAWVRNLEHMDNKVKSFSGFTEHILGYPTEEWLHGD